MYNLTGTKIIICNDIYKSVRFKIYNFFQILDQSLQRRWSKWGTLSTPSWTRQGKIYIRILQNPSSLWIGKPAKSNYRLMKNLYILITARNTEPRVTVGPLNWRRRRRGNRKTKLKAKKTDIHIIMTSCKLTFRFLILAY